MASCFLPFKADDLREQRASHLLICWSLVQLGAGSNLASHVPFKEAKASECLDRIDRFFPDLIPLWTVLFSTFLFYLSPVFKQRYFSGLLVDETNL